MMPEDYLKFAKRNILEDSKQVRIDGIVPRIKLLNVLGLALTILISEIRSLRNEMEHEYTYPSIDSVKRGI